MTRNIVRCNSQLSPIIGSAWVENQKWKSNLRELLNSLLPVSEVRDFIFLFRSSFIARNSEIKSCWFKFVICDVMYMQTRKLKNLGFTIKKILSFTSNLHNFENARSHTEQFLAFAAQTHSTKCRIQIQYPNWCYFIYSGNLSDSWCSWFREKGEHITKERKSLKKWNE